MLKHKLFYAWLQDIKKPYVKSSYYDLIYSVKIG